MKPSAHPKSCGAATFMLTKAQYDAMMKDRPNKATATEVNYRRAKGKEQCSHCFHFFSNRVRHHSVCEIFRPSDDGTVYGDYVCDWFTTDRETFPLQEPTPAPGEK